jgi:hypothetical protein
MKNLEDRLRRLTIPGPSEHLDRRMQSLYAAALTREVPATLSRRTALVGVLLVALIAFTAGMFTARIGPFAPHPAAQQNPIYPNVYVELPRPANAPRGFDWTTNKDPFVSSRMSIHISG